MRARQEKSLNGYQRKPIARLEVEGISRRYKISNVKQEHVEHIKRVIFEDREDYWPLSVRGVHYPLLNYTFWRNTSKKLPYLNDKDSYKATSNLLTRMRLNGQIPWEAISDETRPVTEFPAFTNAREFVRQETDKLFCGYWRNRQQTQPNYVECIVEKNTIYEMALRVTRPFQISDISAADSVASIFGTPVHTSAIERAGKNGSF